MRMSLRSQSQASRWRKASAGSAASVETAVLQQSRVARAFEDGLRQEPRAFGIERLGDRIFVEQGFDFERRAMAAGKRQRRRHVADGERANAPFGLRRLARIVDDEGVDDRQRAKHRLGRAVVGERRGLAREPFERAMGAAMDHRIDLFILAEPDIESDVGMAGRQARIMIVRLAMCGHAAIGLQRDEHIFGAEHGEGEPAVPSRRVRRAPMRAHGLHERRRHGVKRREHSRRVSGVRAGAASSRWRINSVRSREAVLCYIRPHEAYRQSRRRSSPCRDRRHSRCVLACPDNPKGRRRFCASHVASCAGSPKRRRGPRQS